MTNLYLTFNDLGRPFWRLWLGESITSLGTLLVQFALGVWVYQRTGSALDFAGITVAGLLPQLLAMPVAGNLVDQLERRRVIILSDCLAAVMSVALIVLLLNDALQVWHLYAFTMVASLSNAFREPAYRASVGTLLRDDQLTRASGLMGVSGTALGILAPTLAGTMLMAVGLAGLVTLDLITFLVGTALVWQAFSHLQSESVQPRLKTVLHESFANFRRSLSFFRKSVPLSGLLLYSVVQSTLLALAVTLVTPLILANHSPQALGLALSFAAAGALVGSILMALVDSPRRRMAVILASDAVLACCIAGIGMADSLALYCALEALACCAGSVGASCAFALWISKAPEDQRGSILVVQGTATTACTAIVVLASGVADLWLEPALASGNVLAGLAELLPGPQKERGIATLFVIAGAAGLATALAGYLFKPLRNLE